MIDELRKRPMVRPLLLWISGICLYVLSPHAYLLLSLLICVFVLLLFSSETDFPMYAGRWHWGLVFSLSILVLAVLISAYRDIQDGDIYFVSRLVECAAKIRLELSGKLESLELTEIERNVLAAMLLGDTSTIEREVRMQFSVTGVAHILSVSGFHVAVVCGFYSFFLKPLPSYGFFRWYKYLSTMFLLWSFTFVTGMASPSVRSALMLSLFLTGRHLRRTTDGYNTLAASAFIMLVCNPFYLFDIGFQLSYIAVYSILLLKPPLDNLLTLRNPLLAEPYSWITISIAAQTGTAFLCLYYFSQFPVLFLFANLPFSIASTLLIPAGLIYILLPEGFYGSFIFGFIIEKTTIFLLYIVESFSVFPWSSFIVPFDFFDLLLSYVFLLLFVVFIYFKRPLFLIYSCLLLAVLLIKLLIEGLWLPAI